MSEGNKEIQGSIFTFLSTLFKKHNVQSVLVGGYALIVNKVQRMTFDIDFMIAQEDCKKIEPELLDTGYTILSRQEAFVQLKGEKIGLRDLDFLITDKETLTKIIKHGKKNYNSWRRIQCSVPKTPYNDENPFYLRKQKTGTKRLTRYSTANRSKLN